MIPLKIKYIKALIYYKFKTIKKISIPYYIMNRDIEMLNCGILPNSLNYTINQEPDIDVYKLAYNLRYKTTEYWEK